MTQSEESDDFDLAKAIEELRTPLAGHLSKYSLQSLIGRDWVSIDQFSRLTHISVGRTKTLIRSKELKAVKVGSQFRIYEAALHEYLNITPTYQSYTTDPDEYSF